MSDDLVVQVIAFVLGGGALKFLMELIEIRRKRRQEPAETGGIVAKGAESAVLSMGKSLEAAERRATALVAELDDMRRQLAAAAQRASASEAEAASLRAEVHRLQDQLHGYVHGEQ